MPSAPLRFRQVHLDFHTSPDIAGIGARFDVKHWQDTLRGAGVDSITCFAKCHHGWSYHPTRVGRMHPHLGFDLLRAQYDACKEMGINVPIYLSAGLDDVAAHEHPEWQEITAGGVYQEGKPLEARFRKMDFHAPYLDYLCAQIEEVVELFPDCDGIFLDIIHQYPGCGRWSLEHMHAHGLDPQREEDRLACARDALTSYYQRTTAAARTRRADMPVIHNAGHIPRGDREALQYQNHLELESLPTGGWGYDHFPESAKYAANLGMDFLGMTGKFHTTWGEFGGYKHPNALRYECAAMLAMGARCSVGDQLHPDGELDASTYEIIGAAYREVAAKEPWCAGATQVAEIGVLSSEAEHPHARRGNAPDTGAARVLLEGHYLFTLLDREMDFSRVRVLILPDDIRIDPALGEKIGAFLAGGGRLLLTGESGLRTDGTGFAFDIGADWQGVSPFRPDYLLPAGGFRPGFVASPFVMYLPAQRIRATAGTSLGAIHDPYFNRTYRHYCSHQHTPPRREASGFDGGVMHGNVAYLAHPVFSIYRGYGAVVVKDYVCAVIDRLLGERLASVDLPSSGRITLTRQAAERRWVLHLLGVNTLARGGEMTLSGGTTSGRGSIEVIEELLPIHGVKVRLRLPANVVKVTLEPQGTELPFESADGVITVELPEVVCHQMLVLHEG